MKNSGEISSEDWALDRNELEGLFNNRTRGILLNNPNNPTGKVYTLDELQFIADLAKKHNVYVVTDEAHEWIVYGQKQFTRIGQYTASKIPN